MQSEMRIWRDDPGAFFRAVWPNCGWWSKQREIAYSVRDNWGTIVHACVEAGKDWIAARIALWFWLTRFPCKVLCTSSSNGQLDRVLWGEIGQALREMAIEFPVRKRHKWLSMADKDGRPYENHWLRLLVARDVESWQGVHLEQAGCPRVLLIYDECSAVPDEFFDAGETQAHRLLAIGNPLRATGWFARRIKAGDQIDELEPDRCRWRVIHIDAEETPNVLWGRKWEANGRRGSLQVPLPGLLSYSSYLSYQKEWDEYNRTTRLHGRIYEGHEHVIVPWEWLEQCFEAWDEVSATEVGPCWMGVDVAAGGRDRSVWAVVSRDRLVRLIVRDTPDTVEVKTLTLSLMEEHGIPASRVAVDAGGGGQQAVIDVARRLGHRLVAVAFGGTPTTPRRKKVYLNLRAELYGEAADRIDPAKWERGTEGWTRCFAMDPNDSEARRLAEELASIPKQYDAEGRTRLPPKDAARAGGGMCLRTILGHSPDRSDALAMALWLMAGRRPSIRRRILVG